MHKSTLHIILLIAFSGTVYSQPVQLDERFGVQVEMDAGWSMLSEDLYSPFMHSQLFADENEEFFLLANNAVSLPELAKKQWALGVNSHPMNIAESVLPLKEEEWLFEPPVFEVPLLPDYPEGLSVFFAEAHNWASYVLFISRAGIFTQLTVSVEKKDGEYDIGKLDVLVASITFSDEPPEKITQDFLHAR